MESETRSYDWWAHFFRVRHREALPGIEDWDTRLIDFLVEVLELDDDSRVLDVACGSGVHLKMLAERGIGGLGFDISESLVKHATEAAAEHADLVRFVEGDMRNIDDVAGDEFFDVATVLSGTFGYLGIEEDLQVLEGIHEALAPGGLLLLDCLAPQWAAKPPIRHWEMVEDGYLLSETHYDPASCVCQIAFLYIDADGRINRQEDPERVRVYTLPELMGLLVATDFEYVAAYGGPALPPVPYDAANADRMLVVARKA
jgi:SAM-dependent methyltransferase